MSTPVYLSKDYQRMWDLVRHQRAELHDAGLITQEEYGELVCAEPSRPGTGSPSAKRLASYDELRAALAAAQAERDRAHQSALDWKATWEQTQDALTEARRVLREASGWLEPEISRGPAIPAWVRIMRDIAAVLAQEEK